MKVSKFQTIFTLLSLFVISVCSPRAIAHTPHDDVFSVQLSPNYNRDKTIFSLVRGAVYKSEDSGNSWRRMVQGLDHKQMLFSLDLADDAQTLFVSSLGDGVYKSKDGGETWFTVNKGLETLSIDRVVVAPNSSELVLATGTTNGLFTTRNGGADWQRLSGFFGKVTALTFLPQQKGHVLVGDHKGGLYASRDAGRTWRKIKLSLPQDRGAVTAIAASPSYSSDNTLMVGTEKGFVYISSDTGLTFEKIKNSFTTQPIVSLSLSPNFSSDGIAFASSWDDGTFCSSNRGLKWEPCDRGLTKHTQSQKLGRPSFGEISLSKTFSKDKTVLVSGFDGLFQSIDKGKNWKELTTLSPQYIIGMSFSPNYRNDSTIALTNMLWGAYLSRDGAKTWQSANKGVVDKSRGNGLTRLFSIVFSPNFSADRTLFTSTWYRLLKSTNGGASWDQHIPVNEPWWDEPGRSHGLTIAVSPNYAKDGVIFLGTHRGRILKSKNRGESFELMTNALGTVGSLAISPNFDLEKTIFVGDTHGVHRSINGGESWDFTALVDSTQHEKSLISPFYKGKVAKSWQNFLNIEKGKSLAIKLAISPNFTEDGVVFAGTSNGLFRSSNAGKNWNQINNTPFEDQGYIEVVALSPNFDNDKTLLVTVRGKGLFRSEDGGENFHEIGQKLIQNQDLLAQYIGFIPQFPAIIFSPNFSQDKTIFGFSGITLFRSVDGGDNWEAVKTPAPRWQDRTYVEYLAYMEPISQYSQRFFASPKRIFATIVVLLLMVASGILGIVVLWKRRFRRK